VVNAALEHTAAMAVCGDLDAVSCHGIIDELVILRYELVKAFLNDMIAVEVLDEHHNVQAQRNDDRMNLATIKSVNVLGRRLESSHLTTRSEEVNHFLDRTCTMHV
jgi:hypothetical protein